MYLSVDWSWWTHLTMKVTLLVQNG